MSILNHLRGVLVTAIFSLAIILIALLAVPLALVKLLVPVHALRRAIDRLLDAASNLWITFNTWQQTYTLPTKVEVEGLSDLSRDEWYMLIANHQSWTDILVLVRAFNARIPGVKFFFKQSLLWVPVLGLALWGLDFPHMRRYSKAQLARHPELKGKDVEQTRKACERFRHHPVTIINFLEGTRFTPAKHAQQNSPYRHLLMPRAGGLAFTLRAMNGQLHRLLDVTILYPEGIPTYWDYACGRIKRIQVHIRQLPIPAEMIGDYTEDAGFRAHFQRWVNQLWHDKDEILEEMKSGVGK
ncbi:MAG TPA: acyltransferase [Cellvibrio sp.]|nr:acyltransferase [Cellvibrio sp.]